MHTGHRRQAQQQPEVLGERGLEAFDRSQAQGKSPRHHPDHLRDTQRGTSNLGAPFRKDLPQAQLREGHVQQHRPRIAARAHDRRRRLTRSLARLGLSLRGRGRTVRAARDRVGLVGQVWLRRLGRVQDAAHGLMRHLPGGGRNRAVGPSGLSQRADTLGERAGDFHRPFGAPSFRRQARRPLRPHPPAEQADIHGCHLEPLGDVHPGEAAGLGQLHHHMPAHRDIGGGILRNRRGADVDDFFVGHMRHVQYRGDRKRGVDAGQRALWHARKCNPAPFNIQLNNVTSGLPDRTRGQRLSWSLNAC